MVREIMTPSELSMKYGEVKGYTADTELISPQLTEVQINEMCDVGYKDFHLCPNCRKTFER